jgi:hypothetical protein
MDSQWLSDAGLKLWADKALHEFYGPVTAPRWTHVEERGDRLIQTFHSCSNVSQSWKIDFDSNYDRAAFLFLADMPHISVAISIIAGSWALVGERGDILDSVIIPPYVQIKIIELVVHMGGCIKLNSSFLAERSPYNSQQYYSYYDLMIRET